MQERIEVASKCRRIRDLIFLPDASKAWVSCCCCLPPDICRFQRGIFQCFDKCHAEAQHFLFYCSAKIARFAYSSVNEFQADVAEFLQSFVVKETNRNRRKELLVQIEHAFTIVSVAQSNSLTKLKNIGADEDNIVHLPEMFDHFHEVLKKRNSDCLTNGSMRQSASSSSGSYRNASPSIAVGDGKQAADKLSTSGKHDKATAGSDKHTSSHALCGGLLPVSVSEAVDLLCASAVAHAEAMEYVRSHPHILQVPTQTASVASSIDPTGNKYCCCALLCVCKTLPFLQITIHRRELNRLLKPRLYLLSHRLQDPQVATIPRLPPQALRGRGCIDRTVAATVAEVPVRADCRHLLCEVDLILHARWPPLASLWL
jgi:phosphoribosylanthranilate isomerase